VGPGQLRDGGLSARQGRDDRAPRRIGERLKGGVESSIILNHSVYKYTVSLPLSSANFALARGGKCEFEERNLRRLTLTGGTIRTILFRLGLARNRRLHRGK